VRTLAASTLLFMAAPVLAAPSTTTITSSLNPSVLGQAVTFTAQVSPGHSQGTVDFLLSGTDLLPGCAAVSVDNHGFATCTTSTLAPTVGTPIYAFFSGTATLDPSSNLVLQVVKAPTTVTVTSVPDPVPVGERAYLVATAITSTPGVSSSSSFTFLNNGEPICSGVPLDSFHRAYCLTPPFAPGGSFSITATYSGNTLHLPSTGTLSLNVGGAPFPGAIVGPSTLPWGYVRQYTFSASPGRPAPTGTASYLLDYSPLAACTNLPAFSGVCAIAPQLGIGPHTMVVVYSGDANYSGEVTSQALIVTPRTPQINLSAPPPLVILGESLHLTAHLAFDVVPPQIGGTITVGPCPAVAVTAASADYACDFVPALGTNPVTATYSGISPYGNATVTQWVTAFYFSVSITFPCGLQRFEGQDLPVLVHVDPAGRAGHADLLAVFDSSSYFSSTTQPIVNQEALLIATGLPAGVGNLDVSYTDDATHSGPDQIYEVEVLPAVSDRIFTSGMETVLPICSQ